MMTPDIFQYSICMDVYIYGYIYIYIYIIYIYLYIYIYILYIYLNGRRINYKYLYKKNKIIATFIANSFMYAIKFCRLYIMEENCLMLDLYDR